MKKALSLILALVLALSCLTVCVTAKDGTQPAYFNASTKLFQINEAPKILNTEACSNEYGTDAYAYIEHSNAFITYANAIEEGIKNLSYNYPSSELMSKLLGIPGENIHDPEARVYVQYAYSFDGVKWAGDLRYDQLPEGAFFDNYDLDGDGFSEFCEMPFEECDTYNLYDKETLFNGGYYYAYYYSKDEIQLINNNKFLGKGEPPQHYIEEDDHGILIDFNNHTLYVKARYAVNTQYGYDDGDEYIEVNDWTYSPWSANKTYNNKTKSPEGQDCLPTAAGLKSKDKPVLTVVTMKKSKDDGNTTYYYKFRVDPPESKREDLAKFWALDNEFRKNNFGEYYQVSYVVEFKRGNSDWYKLSDKNLNDRFFSFDTAMYWDYEQLEKLGNTDAGTVQFRVTICGDNSYRTEYDEETKLDKFIAAENPNIISASSDPVEVTLGGLFTVNYHLNGGDFVNGSTQVEKFDEESTLVIDLTKPDYIPEKENYTFKGWYADEEFKTKITSVDTKIKSSKHIYAKFSENKHYNVTYDNNGITAYVWNPNPEKIYINNPATKLIDAESSGINFLGWYTAKTGGTKVTSLKYDTMSGDLTLYAHWDLPSKNITYAGAGKDYVNDKRNPGSFPINSDGDNSTVIYPATKKGYIFDGWYTYYDSESGNYENMLWFDTETNTYILNTDSDTTLYAKFILGRWDVSYEFNIDRERVFLAANPEKHTYGTADKLIDPSAAGYVFKGWYSDSNYTKKLSEIDAYAEGEVKLYGKFEAIKYHIYYDYREVDTAKYFINENPTERTVTDEVILKPLTPNAKEYKFLGFYNNPNFDGAPVTTVAKETTKDIQLYANVYKYQWGDINFDGKITAEDARLALRYSVGLEPDIPVDALYWADVDNNSEKHEITSGDARIILRMAVGLDTVKGLKLGNLPKGF